jgi:tricorn protease
MFRIRTMSIAVFAAALAACATPSTTAPHLAAPAVAAPQGARATTKLLRFPDVHAGRVVFCYAGDLWSASTSGGDALRLTAHPGIEVFPRHSPDGRWIAFTGQYDGDEQVYVIPSGGGAPRQLTWYPSRGPLTPRWGYDNQVYGWSADSKRVLFRSMRDGFDLTDTRLYWVGLDGSQPEPLPMPVSGGGDLSPDGKSVVYSPLTRDFRTWKRYEGGWAQELYIYDLATAKLTPVAHSKRTERDPMWIGDSIWFASDRDGHLNLYRYGVGDQRVEQVTKETQWDLRWPSKGESGEIVYEKNGELELLDTQTRKISAIPIHVPSDLVSARPERVDAGAQLEGFALSPKGERALFTARGDVFSAPIEKGFARNLTNTSGAHERGAQWSPDGATVAFISDKSGEEEIYTVAQDGSGAWTQLTQGIGRRIDGLAWSPDGKSIVCDDCSGRIWMIDVAAKSQREIALDPSGRAGDYSWAPDSRWLAYSAGDANGFRSLHLWSAADGSTRRITDELWNEYEPVFSRDGQYLYYLSEREFAPQLSQIEWNFAANRWTGVFALALRKDVKHPLPPESDEVALRGEDAQKGDAKKDDAKQADAKQAGATQDGTADSKPESKPDEKADAAKAPPEVKIDFDGLAQRVVRLPLEPDNYGNLIAGDGRIWVGRAGAPYYGRESERENALVEFDFKERKTNELVEGAGGYVVSADASKLLVRTESGFALLEAGKGKDKKSVSTKGLYAEKVPVEEWRAIYNEAWRRFRDYFYVPNMHGYDWEALRKQYEPWLAHVAHRADLNYLLGELVAELNVGHAYISGGDIEAPARVPVALFGGRMTLDRAAGRYKLSEIFPGHNEEPAYRSPLTEVGVDAKVGDYVLAIDGVDLPATENPYRLLRGKADRPVEFLLNDKPSSEGARKVVWRPVRSETNLLYLAFVLRNKQRVDELSGGRVAYVHLPDMGEDGIREFSKWFYGQVRKEGLIVDDRNNGGGNVSSMVLERLRRTLLGLEYSRHDQFAGTYPQTLFNGPMVCLLNQNSASDGDIFPWMFRNAGLGPLIGKRSWGGVVGITDHGPLLDGGRVNVPEFGHLDKDGQWAIEGVGVEPDIEIENEPADVIAGRDPQLERGVQEVLARMAKRPAKLAPRPADPVKTK